MPAIDCTPYLLQLGLTKSKTSLVWIAGPLSGLIMQPVVGVLADSSKSKWGRRRPFMVGGSLIVGACLIVLGWTAEIVGMFVTEEGMVIAKYRGWRSFTDLTATAETIMHHCAGRSQYLCSRFCDQCR